jgi:hypothetical protein
MCSPYFARVFFFVGGAAAIALGCDADPPAPAATDAGHGDDAGPPPVEACDEPDRACPDAAPYGGAACEGDLACSFVHPDAGGTEPDWFFECREGQWVETELRCFGCQPLLAEACPVPFIGTLPDATVALGPVTGEAFAPFAEGARVQPVFGPQGLAMLDFQIHVEADAPPTCASVTIGSSLEAMSVDGVPQRLRMRCGNTLRVFTMLPDLPCESRDYAAAIEVDIQGVGSTTASVIVEGGSCPRTGP